MVREMSVKGNTVFQCETCSDTFDAREEAEAHEQDCLGPATM